MCSHCVVEPGIEDQVRREESMNTIASGLRRKARQMMRSFRRAAAQKRVPTAPPSMFDRVRSRRRCSEEGGVLIEFAVFAPIMLLLMTGIFTFGVTVIK
jgi:Flp pilus assembly protein TadG